MLPLKLRLNHSSKLGKAPQSQPAAQKFPAGFVASAPQAAMPGSMPGSMPGISMAPKSPQKGAKQPLKLPVQQPQTPHPSQPLPRQRSGPSPPVKSMLAPDPRRVIVDHIIRDCYSKLVMVDGKKVPEIKYNTHLLVREYALYPQAPPPADLSPAQIGQIKTRILVVCTKHTGRVLLQKGKYNDQKKVYQIGRTWDLDELACVSRVASDAFILRLNKDYYWKSGDDPGRLHKFVHHLAVIHHRFMGHYPPMQGFTLEGLGLAPPHSAAGVESRDRIQHSVQGKQAPASAPQTQTSLPVNHYLSMDFTVNGTLPVKPMQVMDVDRPLPGQTDLDPSARDVSTRQSTGSSNFRSAHDAVSGPAEESTRDSLTRPLEGSPVKRHPNYPSPQQKPAEQAQQSFVFAPVDDNKSAMPTILEYARKNGLSLPLRNYKPDRETATARDASENLETAALYGLQLENRLGDHPQTEPAHFEFELPKQDIVLDPQNGDVDSIEEASLTGSSIETQIYVAKRNPPNGHQLGSRKDSVIDDSIREIEDFMASQFGNEPEMENIETAKARHSSENRARKLLAPLSVAAENDPTSIQKPLQESERDLEIAATSTPEPLTHIGPKQKLEKDPEIEELLDEMGWNPTDGADNCVKMLRKELASVRRRNVSELTTLDFGKDTLANEVKVSSGEIDNLTEIFKKMEANFKMIAPQINNIENNSKGLQVEAVNKKILYNELKEIMHKVRLSDRDLRAVANYEEFDDLSMVPVLESKLLMLYDALGAIGNKTEDDDLSQMRALKQFNDTYEQASLSFVRKYLAYITSQFKCVIEELNGNAANIYPDMILPSFHKQYAFVGVNSFVKFISERDFRNIVDKINSYAATFFENVLSTRSKGDNTRVNSSRNSRLAYKSDPISSLKKNKSSRFGSARLLGRGPGSSGDLANKPKSAAADAGGSEEIGDARLVVHLAKESTEFMLVTQFFLGSFFHLTSEDDFATFIKNISLEQRNAWYEEEDIDSINYKTNSHDLLRSMNAIFGNFINKFTREITPADLVTIQVLIGLFGLLADAERRSQDFVAYSFLFKLTERYKANWDRFVAYHVDVLNKSDVRAKGGLLPAVRNLNQIITVIETSEHDAQTSQPELTAVDSLILQTYSLLTKAACDLFSRDDPLLKSNAHDEKERAYRNVAILQNLFFILQQLDEYDSLRTAGMSVKLKEVFKTVQQDYFDYIIRMHIGRICDFVTAHGHGDQKSTSKKESKILVRGICSAHSPREMSLKIAEMHKRLERQVVSSDTVLEHDLLDFLWKHLEVVVETVFRDFHLIARTIDKDIEESVSAGEIRRLFGQEHPTK